MPQLKPVKLKPGSETSSNSTYTTTGKPSGSVVAKGEEEEKDTMDEVSKNLARANDLIKACKASLSKEDMDLEKKKRGLWDNVHAKRERGESPAKPGDKDYPKQDDLEDAQKSQGSDRIARLLKEHGLEGVNKPKMTPSHPTKKAVVLAKEGDTVKLIRFGAKGYGHNYSSGARSSFKARHGSNIKRGKLSAAYWADKFLWAGDKGSKKNPPKGQSMKKSLDAIEEITKALKAGSIVGLSRRARMDAAYRAGVNLAKQQLQGEPAEPVNLTGKLNVGISKEQLRPSYEPPVVPVRRVQTPNQIPTKECGDHEYDTHEAGPQEAKEFWRR